MLVLEKHCGPVAKLYVIWVIEGSKYMTHRGTLLPEVLYKDMLYSDAASEWAGWALAHSEFGSSVNPISARGGADYAHHIAACPSGFENLTTSLYYIRIICQKCNTHVIGL